MTQSTKKKSTKDTHPHPEAKKKNTDKEKIAELTVQLAAKDAELKDAQDRILRLRAEFDNVRKRLEKERFTMSYSAEERLLLEILPVLDSFDRATASFEKTHSADDIFEGLTLIQKQFEGALTRLGVRKVDCRGKAFDAAYQDALLHQESSDAEENTVLDICQQGYTYKDKVIRHAQVVIAKSPAPQDEDGSERANEEISNE